MRSQAPTPVLQALHKVAHDQGAISIRQLADAVGIAASSLYAKLNPYDERQLNVVQLLRLLDRLEPLPFLDALCHRYGFRALPESCPVPNGHSIHEEMVHDHVAHAEFCRAIEEGASVDKIASLARRAIREIEETLALYHRVRHQAQGPAGGGAASKTGGEWPA